MGSVDPVEARLGFLSGGLLAGPLDIAESYVIRAEDRLQRGMTKPGRGSAQRQARNALDAIGTRRSSRAQSLERRALAVLKQAGEAR